MAEAWREDAEGRKEGKEEDGQERAAPRPKEGGASAGEPAGTKDRDTAIETDTPDQSQTASSSGQQPGSGNPDPQLGEDIAMQATDPEEPAAKVQRTMLVVTAEEEPSPEYEEEAGFYDEDTGLPLPKEAVEKAMAEELAEYSKHGVGEEVSIEACYAASGKAPVSCRWRIHNKGDQEKVNIRARLVAREMKRNKPGWETVFAGTPPLWAFRYLVSSSRTARRQPRGAGPRKLRILDIRRAFFHSDHSGTVHVLPPAPCRNGEVLETSESDVCHAFCGRRFPGHAYPGDA